MLQVRGNPRRSRARRRKILSFATTLMMLISNLVSKPTFRIRASTSSSPYLPIPKTEQAKLDAT